MSGVLLIWRIEATRSCKPTLVRSLGLSGRISPGKSSALCPELARNCCTRIDEMKLHKTWRGVSRGDVEARHREALQRLSFFSSFLRGKDVYSFEDSAKVFVRLLGPPKVFGRHLQAVARAIDSTSSKLLSSAASELLDKKRLEMKFSEVAALRRNVLCALCDHENHSYISPESKAVTYKTSFCLTLVERVSETLDIEYNRVYRIVLLVDEFLRLVSGRSFLQPAEASRIRRHANAAATCIKDRRNITACEEVCREFRLNGFSPMFDGEAETLLAFQDEGLPRLDPLMKATEAALAPMFSFRAEDWSQERMREFLLNESALSTVKSARYGPNSRFGLKYSQGGVKALIEVRHPSNTIQLDLLDDELSSATLYRLTDPPVDFNEFFILFDPIKGVDLFRDIDRHNFMVSADQFLAILNAGGGDLRTLDEEIEDDVKDLLKTIEFSDFKDFFGDVRLEFKRYSPTKDVQPPKDSSTPQPLQKSPAQNSAPRELRSALSGLSLLRISSAVAFILIMSL